jgi:hypothetical protein
MTHILLHVAVTIAMMRAKYEVVSFARLTFELCVIHLPMSDSTGPLD